MSEQVSQTATRPTGDREYFWFALLLIGVLTTSANTSYRLPDSAANAAAAAAQP